GTAYVPLGGHGQGGDAGLHVARTAPVQAVAVDLRAVRRVPPRAAAQRDRVEVPGQRHRLARPPAGEQSGTAGSVLVAPHREAGVRQPPRERFGDRGLVPAHRVDPDQLACQFDRLVHVVSLPAAGRLVCRTTMLGAIAMRCAGRGSPALIWPSRRTASAAISSTGWRTVVSGGSHMVACPTSSKPTTD